jgi:trehalose 6-phosphate synthase/phosphatase
MERANVPIIQKLYFNSRRRLFFLDYEGTLVPQNAGDADPSTIEGLNEMLFQLSSDSQNQVVVMSDQTKEALEDRFNYLPIILAAERGGFFRTLKNQWQSTFKGSVNWKDHVARALNTLTHYYKGSFVHARHFSLAWHHSGIDNIPKEELRQFQVALRSLAKTHALEVHETERGIEFITPGVSKAKFASVWAGNHGDFDFVFAIGNDQQDETLFETLGKENVTVRVGHTTETTQARYYLESQKDVIPFLRDLLNPEQSMTRN